MLETRILASAPTIYRKPLSSLSSRRGINRSAPFYWLTVPEGGCDYVRAEAAEASYGWGAVPVRARIGATEWETSLLPKNGGYVLPVKNAVRRAERVVEGDLVVVGMSVAPRAGRQANGTGPAC